MNGLDDFAKLIRLFNESNSRLWWSLVLLGIVWTASHIAVQVYSQYQTFHVEKTVRDYQTLRGLIEAGSKAAALIAIEPKDAASRPETTTRQALVDFETLYWGAYGLMSEPRVEECFVVLRRELMAAADGFRATPRSSNTQVHLQKLLTETGRVVKAVHDTQGLWFWPSRPPPGTGAACRPA